MDAPREFADLDERLLRLLVGAADELGRLLLRAAILEPASRAAEVDRQRDQAGLGAVVKVALDLAPVTGGRRHGEIALRGARGRGALELPMGGAEERPHEEDVEGRERADDPRREEDEQEAAADEDEPLPGLVDHRSEHVAAILGRDREVPRGRGHGSQRDRPEHDGRDEENQTHREGEHEQVHERPPGGEVDEWLEETSKGPCVGHHGRRLGNADAEQRAGHLALHSARGPRQPERRREERQADDEDDQAQARGYERQEDAEPGDAERERDQRIAGLLPGAEAKRRGEEAGNVHGSSTVRSALPHRDGATPSPAARAFPTCGRCLRSLSPRRRRRPRARLPRPGAGRRSRRS